MDGTRFRRGIATRLFYLGTDGKTVQTILRHANITTMLAHYVIPDPAEVQAAMKRFGRSWEHWERRARSSTG
jgi:integrase